MKEENKELLEQLDRVSLIISQVEGILALTIEGLENFSPLIIAASLAGVETLLKEADNINNTVYATICTNSRK